MKNKNKVIFIIAMLAIMIFTTSIVAAQSSKPTSSLDDAMSGIIADIPDLAPEVSYEGIDEEGDNGLESRPMFTSEEATFIKNSEIITVGIIADRTPFSFHNTKTGEITGIDVDILNLIAEKSGLKFEMIPIPDGKSLVGEMLAGSTQLAMGVVRTDEILQNSRLQVSSIILENSLVVVAPSGMSYEPLNRYEVVAVPLWKQTESSIRANLINANITYKESVQDCADAVKKGKADLFVENAGVVNLLLQKPCYDDLEVLPIYFDEEYSCIAQRSEDNPVLMSVINKSIEALSEEEVNQLIVKHTVASPYRLNLADILYKYKVAVGVICLASVIVVALTGRISRTKQRYFKEIGEKNLQLMIAINKAEKAEALEKEKMKIAESPFDLEGLIGYVSSGGYYKCMEKGLSFEVILKGVKAESLLGDQMNLTKIIFNLLGSAVEATESGGKIKIYITQEAVDDHHVVLTFKVQDTGCGMSRECTDKNFKPFNRKDRREQKPYEKTEERLFVTQHLVDLMGGTLTVESKGHRGTTSIVKVPFVITKDKKRLKLRDLQALDVLKIDRVTKQSEPEIMQSRLEKRRIEHKEASTRVLDEEEGYNFAGCKVLLAEEEVFSQEIEIELLEMIGIDIDCASNGEEVVNMFAESKPYTYDIIIVNINMSKYNGYEVARLIRESSRVDARTVAIIALAEDAVADIVYEFKEMGIDEYLTKPIDVNLLYKVLNNYHNAQIDGAVC